MPGLIKSFQSLIAFGLPLRTRNTMVDVYGELLLGKRFCQSEGRSFPFSAMASISYANASVTTSAGRPSMTDRACLPEPPWDCLMVNLSPVFALQYLMNAP